nr:hypothetical protein [Tanacetum cinerariifolium]
MISFGYRLNPHYAIKECSSCGALYTQHCSCSKGNIKDKILVPKPPKNCARCAKCGHPVNGPYCQGCALLREKLEEYLVSYLKYFQESFESSEDSTNVVNAPREPFVPAQGDDVHEHATEEVATDVVPPTPTSPSPSSPIIPSSPPHQSPWLKAEIYNIDLDHSSKVLSMQEDDTEVQKAIEVVTTAKLITEVVTAAATQNVAASTPIPAAKPKILKIAAAHARLEIVQDEDDYVFIEATPLAQKVPVVDYQIVVIDNKPKYPLSRFTLEQLVNVARLQVEEESEMSLELLRFTRQQLLEYQQG